MNYWQYLKFKEYLFWTEFIKMEKPKSMILLSIKSSKNSFNYSLSKDEYIISGNKNHSLPQEFRQQYFELLYTIPMLREKNRSHNLANSVAIVIYEAICQKYFK